LGNLGETEVNKNGKIEMSQISYHSSPPLFCSCWENYLPNDLAAGKKIRLFAVFYISILEQYDPWRTSAQPQCTYMYLVRFGSTRQTFASGQFFSKPLAGRIILSGICNLWIGKQNQKKPEFSFE
jgi:hypothetical protein